MVLWVAFLALAAAGPLSIAGGRFILNGRPVFLNGINQAWNNYAQDFGNGKGAANLAALTSVLDQIKNSGGNSVRIWLHINGENTPQFDSQGYVTGMDNSGSIIPDMTAYMNAAASRNILVFWVLWNGAVISGSQAMAGLITVDAKLTSYIDKALKPMVTALKGNAGLGGWEIMNEPEGAVIVGSDANPCWDTTVLQNTGAGWVGNNFYMKDLQRFIGRQAKAIHTADPSALVTVGSWSERSFTSNFNWKNFYSDSCLQAFGDALDFPQIHTYDYQGAWSGTSPFQKLSAEFGHTKPLVIGEFSSVASTGMTIQAMYQYAKNNGYAGAWGWQAAGGYHSDSMATLQQGMASINNTYGAVVVIVSNNTTSNATNNNSNSNYNNNRNSGSALVPASFVYVLFCLACNW